ncbi:SAV_915 family protein [Streptomyces sp. V4-01]|uniref:SAV_915 family protein n=1 Tax=Actinacidiphila polyblastidii TaxID=3110430 RepID=A0ABU7PHI8_9ACTN|nr:SAV_915 family protein [Streptomyces sp. V4-01]
MAATDHAEDPEPSRARPAGLLYVPVRQGPSGCSARFFRTSLGGRTAVGFTSPERLTATLGAGQAWISLSEPALRALAEPLGVGALTVDPAFSAPAAAVPAAAVPAPAVCLRPARPRRPHGPAARGGPRRAGVLRVAGATVLVSCLNLLIG